MLTERVRRDLKPMERRAFTRERVKGNVVEDARLTFRRDAVSFVAYYFNLMDCPDTVSRESGLAVLKPKRQPNFLHSGVELFLGNALFSANYV